MHSHICSPKDDTKDFHTNFELRLVDAVTNGDVLKALSIFNEFVDNNYQLKTCNCKTRSFKNQIISICCLLCHEAIKKGVTTYNAKAKNQAFVSLVEKCFSISDLKNLGEKLVKAYSMQVTNSFSISKDAYVNKALGYIHINTGEELTLENVSEYVNLSKCYFCTLFKKEMDMSFSSYLNQVRLEKSKFLILKTDQSILDIAISLGFNSQSYFCTQFKKYTGMTPKQYRGQKDLINP